MEWILCVVLIKHKAVHYFLKQKNFLLNIEYHERVIVDDECLLSYMLSTYVPFLGKIMGALSRQGKATSKLDSSLQPVHTTIWQRRSWCHSATSLGLLFQAAARLTCVLRQLLVKAFVMDQTFLCSFSKKRTKLLKINIKNVFHLQTQKAVKTT